MLVELIGPLVDDGGAASRAITDTLAAAGLELLPGAAAQVTGMAPSHAVRTLIEGHGRFELLEQLDQLVGRVERAVAGWGERGVVRASAGAEAGLRAIEARGAEVVLVTTLPTELASGVLERAGITARGAGWLEARDARGLPHPDHLRPLVATRGSQGALALVGSVGAALAATAAGCGRVVAVGRSGGAALFADEVATSLASALAGDG